MPIDTAQTSTKPPSPALTDVAFREAELQDLRSQVD